MTAMAMRLDISENVATCTFTRPPVNALDTDSMREVTLLLEDLSTEADVSVVVLRGEGRGFCAGADLRAAGRFTAANSQERAQVTSAFFRTIYDLPCATIAAIHGYAIGAGLGVAALCDIRIATDDAVFAMPEIDFAISVGGGGSKIARLGVRSGVVRELMFTGRKMAAAEALSTGLIDHVVPPNALDEQVDGLVRSIASKSTDAVQLMKQALNVAEREAEWERGYVATRVLASEIVARVGPSERTADFLASRKHNRRSGPENHQA